MAAAKKGRGEADWINELHNHVTRYIKLETLEGVRREGRLSGFVTRKLKINGREETAVVELELNGDPQDRVSYDRIASLDFI